MSKIQDVEYALSALETALDIILDSVPGKSSFRESARADLERARRALDGLYEHDQEARTSTSAKPAKSCLCDAIAYPPCSWCENGGGNV